jgi:16S rRNA (uracil1498-N3)-methyltransferase
VPRFYVPPADWSAENVILSPEESRHAAQVLRLAPGAPVEIFDGTGRVAEAVVANVGRRLVELRIERESRITRVQPEVHLIVALVRGERFDWLLQKATELGAASIRPVSAGRCVVKIAEKDRDKRRAKWTQISVEAAKQCGHVVLPEICPLTLPAEAFRAAPPGLRGIPALFGAGRPLREFFAPAPSTVTFAIGPEGDWTAEEMAEALAADFVPLHLGVNVLRSETAALHVLSAAAHHYHGGAGGLGEQA